MDLTAVPSEEAPPVAGRRITRRRRAVLAAAVGAALVSVGAVAGSSFVQSPAQAAADTRPPKASVITAAVASQVLRSTVVLRGTFSDGKKVSITPTSVAATDDNPGGAGAVLTRVMVRTGDEVTAGVPLVEYSGRPVFALEGVLPTYRDLTPGESGADVAQLQNALKKLGHDVGTDEPGRFGPGTKRALKALYTAMGYPTPVTGATTAAAVKSARQEVDRARAALREGQQPATAATGGASAPAAPPAGGADPSTGARPGGGGSDLTGLRQGLARAEDALEQAERVDGPMLPASECLFLPSFPARVSALPLEVGDSVKGPVLSVAQGEMLLTGSLDPAQASLVKPGMPVQVLSESQGRQADGTIASVGTLVAPGDTKQAKDGQPTGQPAPAANGGAAYVPLAISPQSPWDRLWAGQDVRITITSATTTGPVLVVPVAAVFAGADTRTNVTTVSQDGTQRPVNVTVGPSADGLVQVTPLADGELAAGDRVVIGQ
ncbi:peptidoglycan-binding protein [Kitasatospora sp. NBC_00240]|uniref:peptidoglycan-binding protein n=1 Tax=Kitasatospora sp. NBC_00240 TaxID=2903567 RepID=UPI002259575A|nr:peptidoglycan-binding domain-containing protein [Kitasatospora sp. NBC_00240]MCX5209129.1 peptidoglycan-binding protein [Kitasatospora sp. NBC_00240]